MPQGTSIAQELPTTAKEVLKKREKEKLSASMNVPEKLTFNEEPKASCRKGCDHTIYSLRCDNKPISDGNA